ncbi:MAG: hypothetical protein ACRDVN_09575 [Jiangellaceae bacterium]
MTTAAMVMLSASEQVPTDEGVPSAVWGLGILGLLLGLLIATWVFGRGRPHA